MLRPLLENNGNFQQENIILRCFDSDYNQVKAKPVYTRSIHTLYKNKPKI